MSYATKKLEYGTKLGKIVDIFLYKCKYTDSEWVGYGAGTLAVALNDSETGSISLSGTTAAEFNEPNVWLSVGDELIKCTVTDDTTLNIVNRGDLGTLPESHLIGATATIKHSGEVDGSCYGLTDCSAVNNYVKDLEVRFRFPSSNLDLGEKYFHGLESEKPRSPTVKPSESMGSRGTTTVTIKDGKENDSYVPYANHRTDNGTLWSKVFARNPYFSGRRMEVYEGFVSQQLDLNDYQKRVYIIDDAQLDNGKVSFKAADPLLLTEDKKAKAPLATPITLATDIIDASTFFDYAEAVDFFFGPATTQFYVRIDSEVILCEVLSEQRINIITRAVGGTDQKDHDIRATVQYVLYYNKQNAVEIIKDLIESYTDVDASYLDDYTAVIAATSTILLTAFITKPTEVKKLIDEIIQTALLTMWFSPSESKIKIVRSNDPNIQPISINEENNIGIKSFKDKRLQSQQVTRASVAFAPNDITKDTGDENFSVVYKPISASLEAAQNKGEVNERKTFFCRWLINDGDDPQIASAIADDWVTKNAEMPTEVEFELDESDVGVTASGNLDLASIVNVTTSQRVNPDGSPLSDNYQIVSINPKDNMRRSVKAVKYQQPISGDDVDLVISADEENYILSDHLVTDGPREYSVLVDTGATVFSSDTSLFAFDYGTLPADVTSLNLIVRGAIKGMGAAGSNGGIAIAPSPDDIETIVYSSGQVGNDGGDALNVTVNTTIVAGAGAIYAGGGSPAGRYSVASSFIGNTFAFAGDASSGAQGYGVSLGGNGGLARVDTVITDNGLDGNTGSNAAPGSLGGLTSGRYGEDGEDDNYTISGSPVNVPGGKSGVAIKKNGFSVTIQSGAVDIDGNIRGTIED